MQKGIKIRGLFVILPSHLLIFGTKIAIRLLFLGRFGNNDYLIVDGHLILLILATSKYEGFQNGSEPYICGSVLGR
jgi:hypothetical protein